MSEPVTPSIAVAARHYGDYLAQIAQWTAKGIKHLETMADATSGRIPVTRLESWREFSRLLAGGATKRSFGNRWQSKCWPWPN
jgi:hypothetical protein